jgi:hypothetical protein
MRHTSRRLRLLLPLAAVALASAPVAALAQTAADPAPAPAVYGDVNGDGQVSVLDALAVLAYVTGRSLPADYTILPNGDANGDGQVTAADALVIASFAVGRDVSAFRVGQTVAVALPPEDGGARAVALAGYTVTADAATNNQVGWAGDSLPAAVRAIVKDGAGNLVPSVTVYWSIVAGGGALRVATSNANASGIATNKWAPGSSGQAKLRASIKDAGGAVVSYADFTATVVNPAKASITIDSGDQQTGVAGDSLAARPTVQVKDSAGSTYKGLGVAWTVLTGGGSATARTTTSTLGLAATRWTTGPTFGTQTLRAQIPNGPSVTFTAEVLSRLGRITKLADNGYGIAGDSMVTGGWVEVTDSLGTPLSTYVYWTPQDGSSVTATRSRTSATTGRAVTKWILGATPGAQHLRARVDSIGTVVVTATAVAASDVTLAKRGDAQVAPGGTTINVYLDVKDAAGHPMSAWVAYRPLTGGSPTPAGRAPTNITTGRAVIPWTLGNARGTQTLQASVAGGSKTVTFTALSALTAGDSLTIVSGSTAGLVDQDVQQPPTVRVADSTGHVIAGYPVVFTVESGGGAVDPGTGGGYKTSTTRRTDSLGIAVVPHWKLGPNPGSNTLRATAGARSVLFTAQGVTSAGPAATLQVYSGNNQSGTATLPLADSLKVVVVDANGIGVPGVSVSWSASSGGGAVSPSVMTSDSRGVARTRWTLGPTSGTQTVQASASGLSPVTFTATAAPGPIKVSVRSPNPGEVVADTLRVVAAVTSEFQITSVVASVADRQVTLTPSSGYYEGRLVLTGLPQGSATLTVTATDYQSRTGDTTVAFTHALRPTVTVVEPVNGTVVRAGYQRVAATCQPVGCTLGVYVGKTLKASATNSIDQSLSFAGSEGTSFNLEIRATNYGTLTASAFRRLYVESNPHLAEVASGAGLAWDADATRLLYFDSVGGVLAIRNQPAGTNTVLRTVAGDTFPQYGYLTPNGAVFMVWKWADAPSPTPSQPSVVVYEWRNGTLTALTTPGAADPYSLVASGDVATWREGSNIVRRDLATGATASLPTTTEFGRGRAAVAPNGDVVFLGPLRYQLFRYSNGTTTQLTSDTQTIANQKWNPLTDGINAAYALGTTSSARSMLVDLAGGAPAPLSDPRTSLPLQISDYDVAGGWTAFTNSVSGGPFQVFSRSPAGDLRQVTFYAASSGVLAMGPTGAVAFSYNNRRLLSLPNYTGTPVDFGRNWGSSSYMRSVFWRDGHLYVLLGRSAYQVTY